MNKTICNLKYPKIDFRALDEIASGKLSESIEKNIPSMEELTDAASEFIYEPISQREASKQRFTELAVKFSREFYIDLEITEKAHCVQADFYFDCMGIFTELKSLLIMADNILMLPSVKGRGGALSLSYNTHSRLPKIH